MTYWTKAVVIISSVIAAIILYKIIQPPKALPRLEEQWWGKGISLEANTSIRPFQVNVSDKVIADLKWKLDHFRPPTPSFEGEAQHYGINSELVIEILEFWKTKYDWKERQPLFNQFPQFLTNIQGLDIHFIHVKPKSVNKTYPLLLLHGFPGSIREFHEIIPFLTSPEPNGRDFAFEVVVASIPGYGWSEGAIRPGLGAPEIALLFKNLMNRLGFERFLIQGGDFGAIILQNLAVLYPESVIGFHSNMCSVFTPLSLLKTAIGVFWPTLFTRADHLDRVYPMLERFGLMYSNGVHVAIQATKPDSIGVSLTDSPVGLAAYILDIFIAAADVKNKDLQDGGLKSNYDYADLLDNVMVYWVTKSMTTAMRLYAETYNRKSLALEILARPVEVPSACARFKNDIYVSDGMVREIYKNLVHLSDYDGGHLAAFQMPRELAEDIFEATEKILDYNAEKLQL